ncbi:MAG: hypothetical protein U0457_12950 [Candidatus Sericytochromatia bacterium]
MLNKYVKYALLLHAEVISTSAKMVKEASEEFIKKNVDSEYEKSLSDAFDGIQKKVKDLSPHLDKIKDLKNNVVDFKSRFNAK